MNYLIKNNNKNILLNKNILFLFSFLFFINCSSHPTIADHTLKKGEQLRKKFLESFYKLNL